MCTHDRDFNSKNFAYYYIENHQKMAYKLGNRYARKLESRGFRSGKILDSGCGFGGMDIVIAERFPECKVTGVDLSEPLLEYARSSIRNSSLEKRIKFIENDVTKLPFEENEFDVVFSVNMVHHIENPLSMLNEIERILAPEGFLYIADLRRSWLKIFEKEIGNALTMGDAMKLIRTSELRNGKFSKELLWWRFEA